jgi:endonuclease-3
VSIDGRRLRALIRRLEKRYGVLDIPRSLDVLDELILTVLSQHTSDRNAERAFGLLRTAYPTWEAVVAAPWQEVADVIRPGGLANTKARRIQAILREVLEREGRYDLSRLVGSDDASAREYLSSLPGVGPKTVAVVMGFALGRETIPVDTHVHRVATRLGLVPKTSAERAQRLLEAQVPDALKTPLHVGLIRHGRETCKAPWPRCEDCVVFDLCPSGPGFLSARASPTPGTSPPARTPSARRRAAPSSSPAAPRRAGGSSRRRPT